MRRGDETRSVVHELYKTEVLIVCVRAEQLQHVLRVHTDAQGESKGARSCSFSSLVRLPSRYSLTRRTRACSRHVSLCELCAHLREMEHVCGFEGCEQPSKYDPLLMCSGCRAVRYCDVGCQKAAWRGHKAA